MVTPTGDTAIRGRILLGSAGDGDDWSTLQGHLKDLGWRVVIFDAVPRMDNDSIEAALPSPDGVDLAVLVIARSDRRVDLLTSRRLNHLVGVLQGQLGFGRVLVLTESGIDSFLHGTGVTEIRYDRDTIQTRFPQVGALLEDLIGGSDLPDRTPLVVGTTLPERLGLTGWRLSPELWVGAGVLVVLVTVLVVASWQLAGGAADPTAGVDGVDGPDSAPVSVLGASPEDGSVASLPARCTLDTSDGMMVPDVVACEGAGGLRVDGFNGPWHTEIASISVDQGVVGQVSLDSAEAAAVGGIVTLAPVADQSLEAWNPRVGVGGVELLFSADGQQVTLHQDPERGGNELTLTFDLDL